MILNMSSPLLSASPRQLPSDGAVLASRRNKQPFSNPRGCSLVQSIFLHSEQSTERISSFMAMFPPPPSTPIPRPNSDIELCSLGFVVRSHALAPAHRNKMDGQRYRPKACAFQATHRPCAYRGAYRDIDINTSGFPPYTRLVTAVWALFLVRNRAMVPLGHGA
ncbi:hypothetical protein BDN71DRAFT_1454736, partial [Pleurotus eryngii]